jgi:ribosome biogenesis protein SSF1/2
MGKFSSYRVTRNRHKQHHTAASTTPTSTPTSASSSSSTSIDDAVRVPQSMIFRHGRVDDSVIDLISDMRKMCMPHTAMNLQERRNQQLRDFVHVAPSINVTHLYIFTQSQRSHQYHIHMRLCRVPRGPTITLRIREYSLIRDVIHSQKHPHTFTAQEYNTSPLVVLHGFHANNNNNNDDNASDGKKSDLSNALKITSTLLQNAFPPIDIKSMKLTQCRRVILFCYSHDTETITMRHYLIHASPVALNKSIKKIVKAAALPNLHQLHDISDMVLNPQTAASGMTSDSEVEDTADNRIILSDRFLGRGNVAHGKSAIRLKEIGPRITFELYKIEDGIADGNVIYHHYRQYTEEERKKLQERKQREAAIKAKRRAEQQANVEAKKANKRRRGQKHTADDDHDNDDHDVELPSSTHKQQSYEMTDADYYTAEVGQAPDPVEFASSSSTRPSNNQRRGAKNVHHRKRVRFTDKQG